MNYPTVNLGNGHGVIIEDYSLKKGIMTTIFETHNMKDLLPQNKYQFLKEEDRVKYIKEKQYWVSPNYAGNDYLLCFVTYKEHKICVLIDRKTLSYEYKKISIDRVNMIAIKIRIAESAYQGTILNCKITKRKEDTLMILTNLFLLEGLVSKEKITKKMKTLNNYIYQNINDDDWMYDYKIQVNSLYPTNNVKELVTKIVKNQDLPINGLVFYPERGGYTYIYNSAKVLNKAHKVFQHHYSHINAIFEVQKTNQSDVYHLFLLNKKGDKVRYSEIAYIPTAQDTHRCKEYFKACNKLIMRCEFSLKMKKWIPIEKVDTLKPDLDLIVKKKIGYLI